MSLIQLEGCELFCTMTVPSVSWSIVPAEPGARTRENTKVPPRLLSYIALHIVLLAAVVKHPSECELGIGSRPGAPLIAVKLARIGISSVPKITRGVQGIRVDAVQDAECIQLMQKFIAENPSLWNEDIGV